MLQAGTNAQMLRAQLSNMEAQLGQSKASAEAAQVLESSQIEIADKTVDSSAT